MISSRRVLFTAALLLASTTATAEAQRGAPDPERAAARQVLLTMASHVEGGHWASADSVFAARGVAWVAFRKVVSAASGPAPTVARGSAVLEKVDGRWIIVHYHVSR